MERKVIKQVLVVEGHHDSAHLKRFYDCDTIETGGTGYHEDTMERIRMAQKSRGVIILTDPDVPGNSIRAAVNEAVPGCLNAYVQKKNARTEHKVGVEHAPLKVLEEALAHLVLYEDRKEETITVQDMLDLGLSGCADSTKRREQVQAAFHLGTCSAKQLRQRLNAAGITKEKIREVLQ